MWAGENISVTDSPEARLLIVEDEPNILELLSAAACGSPGSRWPRRATGRRRRRRRSAAPPDLLVLDVMLPDLDGFDVVRRLRGGGSARPVVFLTARDATEDKIRG